MFLSTFGATTIASVMLLTGIARGVPANIQEIRQEAQERRGAAVQEFENRQEEARTQAEEKRQEFQEKVQQTRDEQKQRTALRLGDNLARMNENWVNHWLRVLDRLAEVLVKMEMRADKAEELGYDLSETRVKIEETYQAISDAQDVLNEQAGNTYDIVFDDEEGLGKAIQAAVQELRADLFETREEVRKAIIATKDALSSLKTAVEGEGEEENGEEENGEDEEEEEEEEEEE